VEVARAVKVVALDTNIVTKLLRGDIADIERSLQSIDSFFIPWAVHGELLSGIKAGSNPVKYDAILEDFLNQNYVIRSDTTADDTIPFYAEIYAWLRRKGTPVSPNDLWVAAECAQKGLPLYTLDKDFLLIPQVLRFQ
jgi:tRNA(fMet)-specific endonuclease VapC